MFHSFRIDSTFFVYFVTLRSCDVIGPFCFKRARQLNDCEVSILTDILMCYQDVWVGVWEVCSPGFMKHGVISHVVEVDPHPELMVVFVSRQDGGRNQFEYFVMPAGETPLSQ